MIWRPWRRCLAEWWREDERREVVGGKGEEAVCLLCRWWIKCTNKWSNKRWKRSRWIWTVKNSSKTKSSWLRTSCFFYNLGSKTWIRRKQVRSVVWCVDWMDKNSRRTRFWFILGRGIRSSLRYGSLFVVKRNRRWRLRVDIMRFEYLLW